MPSRVILDDLLPSDSDIDDCDEPEDSFDPLLEGTLVVKRVVNGFILTTEDGVFVFNDVKDLIANIHVWAICEDDAEDDSE